MHRVQNVAKDVTPADIGRQDGITRLDDGHDRRRGMQRILMMPHVFIHGWR